MTDEFYRNAHVIPEPPFIASAPVANCGREFERLFPGKPCFYCGGVPNSVDHVVPRSRGGKDERNRVPCCFRCNQMKSNMLLEEFVEHMKKILARLEAKGVLRDGKVDMKAVIQDGQDGQDVIQAPGILQFTMPLTRPLAA